MDTPVRENNVAISDQNYKPERGDLAYVGDERVPVIVRGIRAATDRAVIVTNGIRPKATDLDSNGDPLMIAPVDDVDVQSAKLAATFAGIAAGLTEAGITKFHVRHGTETMTGRLVSCGQAQRFEWGSPKP